MSLPGAAAAIYACPTRPDHLGYVITGLRQLAGLARKVILVAPSDFLEDLQALASLEGVVQGVASNGSRSVIDAWRTGLRTLWVGGPADGPVILTSSNVIGPVLPMSPLALGVKGKEIFAPYWHDLSLDPRKGEGGRVPYLDFAVISADLMDDPGFRVLWDEMKSDPNYFEEFLSGPVRLHDWLISAGGRVIYPMDNSVLETFDPRLSEVHKLIAHGAPCIPVAAFGLDRVLYDLLGIDLKTALADLRARAPELYAAAIDLVCHTVAPRDFGMMADQYEVLPDQAADPEKTRWSFGRIAILIHAYYADMMEEFWKITSRMPCEHDLFISTSTVEHKAEIEGFLADRGFPADRTFVVVVEQNRGRDMSSLFITFRDPVLSGRYEVALRLHSKRTPQVSRQVGEGFKRHLFDNLAGSRGFISNVLDLFEAQPDVGMILPPVVQIGFGTLGHGWFINKAPVAALAKDMGFNVRLDDDTPLAPYGTMYWFRTKALKEMFKWRWKWEDYNAEPHHIDGGLAHVQERLICYACVNEGFRVVQVMNPAHAARNYAKLEYKLQLLAARLDTGNILFQRDQLDHMRNQSRPRMVRRAMGVYGWIIRRFPGLRAPLRPVSRFVQYVLLPSRR